MIRLPDLGPGMPKPRVPARPPGRYDGDAEWGGPASLGPAALKRADGIRWGWDVVGADETEHRMAEWQRQEDERFDATVGSLPPAEAKGFAEGYANQYFERAKAFKAALPGTLQPAVDEQLARHEQRLFVKATAAEDNAQANASRQRLDQSLQSTVMPAVVTAAKLARDDPDKPTRLAEAEALAERLIEANPAMAPHDKEARKAATNAAIHSAFAEALPEAERGELDPAAGIEAIGTRFRGLASGRAVSQLEATEVDASDSEDEATEATAPANPDGFGREAWLGAIRRHRPELAKDRSILDILALRSDADLSAEIREEAIGYGARFLIGHGHRPTPGNLYLTHVFSPEEAVRLLDADPAGIAAEVDAATAKERPDLFHADGDPERPRTIAELIAAAEAAMDGTRPVDWRQRLSAVSPDLLKALAEDAKETAARETAATKIADDADYRTQLEEAEQAIAADEFGLADLQKAANEGGWLRGVGDFERLHGLIASRATVTLDYETAVNNYTNPDYHFDATSPEDQRAVDLIYERGTAGNEPGNEEAQRLLAQIVERTGIVPKGEVQLANLNPSLDSDIAKVATQLNAITDKSSMSNAEGVSAGDIAEPSVEVAQAQIETNDGGTTTGSDTRPRPKDTEHLVIFVGGGGDARSEIVKSYSETYRVASGGIGREVLYFENDQVSGIVKAIDKAAAEGRRITLIGHSWGGYAILKAASESGKKIDNLVTVDPVGKWDASRIRRPNSVVNWLNVNAVPDRFDFSDGVEWFGKLIGRKIPAAEADNSERVTANHEDFAAAMALGGVLDLIDKTEESIDLGDINDTQRNIDRPVTSVPTPVPRPAQIDEPPIPRPSPFRPN